VARRLPGPQVDLVVRAAFKPRWLSTRRSFDLIAAAERTVRNIIGKNWKGLLAGAALVKVRHDFLPRLLSRRTVMN
jgi:hypothetical protein